MRKLCFLLAFVLIATASSGQKEANYDESKVPAYTLPDPLGLPGGRKVTSVKKWEKKQRPRLIRLFEEQVYGKIPENLGKPTFQILEEGSNTPYGKGHRKQVLMLLKKGSLELPVQMLLYLPEKEGNVPVFLGYNFTGNHTVTSDVEVRISDSWVADDPSLGIINHQLTEQSRGANSDRWPVQMLLDAGYGVATIYYGDVDPDRDDFSDGVHPFADKTGQTKPAPSEWGSLAAWAWGLSQAMNYLQTDPGVDASKVIVIGHSRLGKAALWAGALDTRFAMVVSNNSGCGGAALSRRKFGETVERINTHFPHWFCDNFNAYNDKEENLPVDQHELIALIAPRPVYIASAEGDQWADPRGEYLAGLHASPVYALYGSKGLNSPDMPPVHQPVMNRIGYHIREGKHDITPYDWQQYIRFAELHFFGK